MSMDGGITEHVTQAFKEIENVLTNDPDGLGAVYRKYGITSLNMSRSYSGFTSSAFHRPMSYKAALLRAVAEQLMPEDAEWSVEEVLGGEAFLFFKGFNQPELGGRNIGSLESPSYSAYQ